MRGIIENTITATGRTIPQLRVQIRIENDEQDTIKIMGYSIKIYLSNLVIGDISNFDNIFLDPRGNHKFDEEFQITPYLFNSIEKERKFGDVPVDARVRCLSIKKVPSKNEFEPLSLNMEYINISQIKLSQSDWAKLVSDMGYINYQIFEIPFSEVPNISDFETIMERLAEAQNHFNQGRNEEVVTSCRKAFESLKPLVAEKNSNKLVMIPKLATKIDSVCKENCQNKKSELVEDLRQKIWPLLHTGPHEGYNVTREDAEYILLLTLSTIRYYSMQLRKLSEN